MDSRSERTRRLGINRSVILVSGSEIQTLEPDRATSELIGLKALGLLRLPQSWVPELFVVSGNCPPCRSAIEHAAALAGMDKDDVVWVRSSGTLEGVQERGSLDSTEVRYDLVCEAICTLQESPVFLEEMDRQTIHFVIQRRVSAKKKGHLSNERRLQRQPRDWMYEVEGDALRPLGVRTWRNANLKDDSPLTADAFAHVPHGLRAVAAWVANTRALIEWVWDGDAVWVVQLDLIVETGAGVHPSSLVSTQHRPSISASQLRTFVPSAPDDVPAYPKLDNARLYASLGYAMPVFYVLEDQDVVARLIEHGEIKPELRDDLAVLCAYPFVLRTDASGLPRDKRQMLPRSDELRSVEAAIEWLRTTFRDVMTSVPEADRTILIGHHFIPAVASAWCQATPDDRRSRIESLWGIPEGLYCFAHDVFDVDTKSLSLDGAKPESARILLRRERFKGKFVAPNEQGEWRVHETAVGPDWRRSIKHDAWVKEIAWTSRRIAIRVGKPVVVMWFIGVDETQGLNAVMPWYHEDWESDSSGYKKAAPRTKINSAQIRTVSDKQDWTELVRDVQGGALVGRVVIDPKDETIIRSRDFVNELAAHAKVHRYVIELSGGVLSHFYHMLSREGCSVECVDLFGVSEEAVEFNKLVRDKIPDEIRQHGEAVQVFELRGDALITSLKRKVVEEAYEVLQATTVDDMADELADLSEVVDALRHALHLSAEDVSDRQAAKRKKRGGFSRGLMLVKTSLPPPMTTQVESNEGSVQLKKLSDVVDLPRLEADFHVDRRIDRSGVAERQVTMTLSTFEDDYSSGEHVFEFPTAAGESQEIFFRSRVERYGATLKLKVRLTRAARQLSLPLSSDQDDDKTFPDGN